jgi:hypothetical protein
MSPHPDISMASVAEEIRGLQAEVRAMRSISAARRMPHGWLRIVISDLETNPHTQYKVHFYGMIYWIINFPAVTMLFFFAPTVWLKWGIFITLVYSIYANFATDYGAMSAAMAAYGTVSPPEGSVHNSGKKEDDGN